MPINRLMPLEKSYKIAIIVIISLLVISATVLRFIPADQGSPMNAISASSRPAALLELSGESISQALNSSTLFVLDFYYPGCGPADFLTIPPQSYQKSWEGRSSSAG